MTNKELDLSLEAKRMTELLTKKPVKLCLRHSKEEVLIIFDDGTRLFVNSNNELDISITDA